MLAITERLCFVGLLAALALATVCGGTEFVQDRVSCDSAWQSCVPITDCALYKTREEVIQAHPAVCHFDGTVPYVCCSAAEKTATPITEGRKSQSFTLQPPATVGQLLGQQCGDPNRTTLIIHRPTLIIKEQEREDNCHELNNGTVICHVTAFAVNGFDAVPGKWPWMAVFGRRQDGDLLGDWFCGGTLISSQYVLTAAHCLHTDQDLTTLGVRIGDHDLRVYYDVEHQDRGLARVIRHPEYDGALNDLALVRLDRPVEMTDAVRPICLPDSQLTDRPGTAVDAAGWGRLQYLGDTPDILQEVPLKLIDTFVCEQAYQSNPNFQRRYPRGFQGGVLCALSRDDEPRDACQGDSGGPLMAAAADGLYQLVGVVSTGVGCGNPDYPGLYTRVSVHTSWILDCIESDSDERKMVLDAEVPLYAEYDPDEDLGPLWWSLDIY